MAASDALPLPRKNVAFRLYFTVRTAAGALVSAFTAPDSEVSKDGGAYADCTNEATYVGRGTGYVDLTSTEMNADNVAFYFSCTEGEIETPVVIYPAEDADIKTNSVMQSGTALTARDIGASVLLSSGTGTGQLDFTSGVVRANPAILKTTIATLVSQTSFRLTAGPAEDDALKGCEIWIVDSSDSNQMTVLVCSGYSGSTKQVTTSLTTPTFTIAVGDNVSVMLRAPIPSTTPGRSLEVDNTGIVTANSTKIGGVSQSAVDIAARIGAPGGASISVDIAAVATTIGTPAGASVSADIAAVKAETGTTGVVLSSAAVDAIWAKAMSDLSAMPDYNASVLAAINAMFMELRNAKASTSTSQAIKRNDGTTTAWTRTIGTPTTTSITVGEAG